MVYAGRLGIFNGGIKKIVSQSNNRDNLMKVIARLIAEHEEMTGEEIHVIRVIRKVEQLPDGQERVNIDVAIN